MVQRMKFEGVDVDALLAQFRHRRTVDVPADAWVSVVVSPDGDAIVTLTQLAPDVLPPDEDEGDGD